MEVGYHWVALIARVAMRREDGRYRDELDHLGIVASKGRRECCYDNAAMESFWPTLKVQLVYRQEYLTREAAMKALVEYIEAFSHCIRIHSSNGNVSPVEFERQRTAVA